MVVKSFHARREPASTSKEIKDMFVFQWIKGIACGLEYFEHEEFGFGVNLDLGILRCTWYRDIEMDQDE